MNEYADLNELRQAWAAGDFNYPDGLTVGGIHYNYFKASSWSFIEAIRKGRNPYIVYHTAATNRDAAEKQGLNQWIVFLWGTPDGATLRPYDIRTVSAARGKAVYEQVETVGDVVLLKIALPSGVVALKGKVDTGAEISSLHVDGNPRIVGQMVQFFNRNASPNAIQAPLVDRQAVSSADGGTEYRPVIELDIEVNGKPVRKAMFNLNDRSKMEYPVLIGQNVLEKTNFLIDPRQQVSGQQVGESEEWLSEDELTDVTDEVIETLFEDVVPAIDFGPSIDPDEVSRIYEALDQSNITISDLFKHVRTQTLERYEDIEY